METLLSKEAGGYDLYRIDEDGKRVTFASTQDYKQKLSLKNCQAIERGYDLDELADNYGFRVPYDGTKDFYDLDAIKHYKAGFQKALEILSDKKFSEKDVRQAMDKISAPSYSKGLGITAKFKERNRFIDSYIQSLQQTEWDVEVEWEDVVRFKSSKGDLINLGEPKLDADGCLILKVKSK